MGKRWGGKNGRTEPHRQMSADEMVRDRSYEKSSDGKATELVSPAREARL